MAKKLLITGKPGVGKTTLISKVMELMGERTVGFYTRELREGGKRVGFEIVTSWGERLPLAHVEIQGPRVSRYGVDVKGLEAVISRLDAVRSGKILVIDEIGKMELLSGKFRRWIEQIFSSDQDLIATVPLKSSDVLVRSLKSSFPVWEVTKENRSHLPFRVVDFFRISFLFRLSALWEGRRPFAYP